jgi:hypothetical protein
VTCATAPAGIASTAAEKAQMIRFIAITRTISRRCVARVSHQPPSFNRR